MERWDSVGGCERTGGIYVLYLWSSQSNHYVHTSFDLHDHYGNALNSRVKTKMYLELPLYRPQSGKKFL